MIDILPLEPRLPDDPQRLTKVDARNNGGTVVPAVLRLEERAGLDVPDAAAARREREADRRRLVARVVPGQHLGAAGQREVDRLDARGVEELLHFRRGPDDVRGAAVCNDALVAGDHLAVQRHVALQLPLVADRGYGQVARVQRAVDCAEDLVARAVRFVGESEAALRHDLLVAQVREEGRGVQRRRVDAGEAD